MSKQLAAQGAIQPDPGETVQSRDSTRLRCCRSVTRDSERSFWRQFTQTAGNRLDGARWGVDIKCGFQVVPTSISHSNIGWMASFLGSN